MNKNQWYGSAILFFLLGTYLVWVSSLFTINIYSSDTTLIIKIVMSILNTFCLFGFIFCMTNGYHQKTPAQEWAEVELVKRDIEFHMELSEMSIKEREEFLRGYFKTLIDISKGKKSLGETVEETIIRVLEKLQKEDSKKKRLA
ncbi:MAG: hypothetical protein HYY37_04795 [Candidatus Aenigmarchaeota archaeon]|nr:hypothetical protein [Candidatus Aenigmarchaeota archaeon]